MTRYVVLIVIFLGMLGIFRAGLDRDPSKLPSPLIDKPAPTYDLPSVRDPLATVGSKDYDGQMVLVNIWATWCIECRVEHNFLMELAAKNVIPIYGLNWRDHREDALVWLDRLGDPYVASAYDEDGRVGIDWGAYGAPETFLIDVDGTILHKRLGALDEAIWQRDFLPKIVARTGETR